MSLHRTRLPDAHQAAIEIARSRGFTYGGRAINTVAAIVRGADRSNDEFTAAPQLPADLPLVVLSASDPRALTLPGLEEFSMRRSDLRLRSHQELAKQSTHGVWKTVPQSGHLIAVTNPEAVIDEIFRMLDGL
jgi:pimeloyl-ACP methyl ester carboxylesterase